MRRIVGSVRFRVTVVATVAVAVLLGLASFTIVRLVERDLIREAEDVVNGTINQLRADLGTSALPEDVLLEYETPDGVLWVGLIEEADAVVGSLIDPDSGDWIGELVLDPETGELMEAFIADEEVPNVAVPADLQEMVASAVRLEEGDFLIAAYPLDGVRGSVASLRRTLAATVPILAVALALLVWWLVGRALRPVGAIISQADRITTRTLHERVPESGADDEIADLARVVNDMLDRIEGGVSRQRQFVADASHELRTPLASIRAAAELSQSIDDPDRRGELAGDVLAEVDRIDDLVEDLLSLARFDEAPHDRSEVVDLRSVVEEVVARTAETGSIEVVVSASPVDVAGDRRQLERVVENLVANAVRHAETRVSISVQAQARQAIVVVTDDGPGIRDEDRERVFERFVRLDESRARGGFGLGLSIVRAIVRGHGGRVVVAAPPPGGGTSVEVVLPRAADTG